MLLLQACEAKPEQRPARCTHEVNLGWHYCPTCGKDVTGFRPAQGDSYLVGVSGPTEKVYQAPKSFEGIQADSVRLYSAKNETEGFQLVLYALSGPLSLDLDTGLRVSDLRAVDGDHLLKSDFVTVLPVGYIPTKPPYYGQDHAGPQPDPLALSREGGRLVRVPRGEVRPIWISVQAPRWVDAGRYMGTIAVKPEGLDPVNLRLDLTVWDFLVPAEQHLPFAFDSISPAWGYPRKPGETEAQWRARLEDVERELFTDMLAHRLAPLRSVGEPEFVRMDQGEARFDYSAFDRRYDRYVRRLKQPAFAIGPEWPGWGSAQYGKWQPKGWIGFRGPQELVAAYRAIGTHLDSMEWHDGAFSYIIDETGGERTKEITRLVHEGDPGMKNLCTIMVQEGYPDIDIWCPRMYELDRKRLKLAKEFQAQGREVWTYTSSPTPPFPSLVMDWDLVNCRILPWMCWKFGLDGYLNWNVDWWKGDVWKDPNNFAGQNGNGFIYYPGDNGPVPTLRVKALRDGLEDYEYLWLLERTLGEMSGNDPEGRFEEAVRRGREALEIGPALVRYFDDFTHNPGLLYARREDMGRALDFIARSAKDGSKAVDEGDDAARKVWKYSPFTGKPLDRGKDEAKKSKVLWDFEKDDQLAGWRLKNNMKAKLTSDHATGGAKAVRLDWGKGGGPSFRYEDRMTDLTKWRYLKFDAYNPGSKSAAVNVKLKSPGSNKQTTLNFNLPPGEEKTISVRLDSLSGKIDLSAVNYFNIFVWEPKEPGTVYVDTIRLTDE